MMLAKTDLNIARRYVEPLHHLQVALLRQYRDLGDSDRQLPTAPGAPRRTRRRWSARY